MDIGKFVGKYEGYVIEKVELSDEHYPQLRIWVHPYHSTEQTILTLQDNGQQCCEYRFLHTDDDLSKFAEAIFTGLSVRTVKAEMYAFNKGTGDIREEQFLIVHTSLGNFTIVAYNEHNGYYGGFELRARAEAYPPKSEGDTPARKTGSVNST